MTPRDFRALVREMRLSQLRDETYSHVKETRVRAFDLERRVDAELALEEDEQKNG